MHGFCVCCKGDAGSLLLKHIIPSWQHLGNCCQQTQDGIQGTTRVTGKQLGRQATLQITCRLIVFANRSSVKAGCAHKHDLHPKDKLREGMVITSRISAIPISFSPPRVASLHQAGPGDPMMSPAVPCTGGFSSYLAWDML